MIEALVTGGSGFLGQHLVQQLLDTGRYKVTVFDLQPLDIKGCKSFVGDLTVPNDCATACEGKQIVFHLATAAPTVQNSAAQGIMTKVNVQGTETLLAACIDAGVKKFIYTGTASAVFEGRPLIDVDETHPYAAKPMDFYTATKIEAEKLVLAANSERLATCVLRPSGIFGPGNDKLTVPTIAERAREGKMKYIIGNGKNLFDWTFVGNVAHAHVCAADKLEVGSRASGQAFFITNDDPYGFWDMMGDICEGLGYVRPHIKMPVWLMMIVAYVSVFASTFTGKAATISPTRVKLASMQRTMSCEKAKTLLGYRPQTDMKQGIKLMMEHFQHLHRSQVEKDKSE